MTDLVSQEHPGMTCFLPPSEGGPIESFEPEERPISMIHSSSRRFPWSPSCYPPPIEMLSLSPSPFSPFLTVEVDSNTLSFFTPDALSPSPLLLPPLSPILPQTLLCTIPSYCSCVVPRSPSLQCVSVARVSRTRLYSF